MKGDGDRRSGGSHCIGFEQLGSVQSGYLHPSDPGPRWTS